MKKIIPATLILLCVLLAACASPAPTSSAKGTPGIPVTGNEVKVSISGFAFNPATVTIKVGQTVTWTNQDTVAHNVVADDNSWSSPSISQGATYSHTFTSAGTFAYHCSIHPFMKATVIVTP